MHTPVFTVYIKEKGTEPAWTPVVKRKRCRRRSCDKVATCQVDESSDEELNIKGVRQVMYQECDGIPGLSL